VRREGGDEIAKVAIRMTDGEEHTRVGGRWGHGRPVGAKAYSAERRRRRQAREGEQEVGILPVQESAEFQIGSEFMLA
jgi:hypothetical protein